MTPREKAQALRSLAMRVVIDDRLAALEDGSQRLLPITSGWLKFFEAIVRHERCTRVLCRLMHRGEDVDAQLAANFEAQRREIERYVLPLEWFE